MTAIELLGAIVALEGLVIMTLTAAKVFRGWAEREKPAGGETAADDQPADEEKKKEELEKMWLEAMGSIQGYDLGTAMKAMKAVNSNGED